MALLRAPSSENRRRGPGDVTPESPVRKGLSRAGTRPSRPFAPFRARRVPLRTGFQNGISSSLPESPAKSSNPASAGCSRAGGRDPPPPPPPLGPPPPPPPPPQERPPPPPPAPP